MMIRSFVADVLLIASDVLTRGYHGKSDGTRLYAATKASELAVGIMNTQGARTADRLRRYKVNLATCYSCQAKWDKAAELFAEVYKMPHASTNEQMDAASNLAFAYSLSGKVIFLNALLTEMLVVIRSDTSLTPDKRADYILSICRRYVTSGQFGNAQNLIAEAAAAAALSGNCTYVNACSRLHDELSHKQAADKRLGVFGEPIKGVRSNTVRPADCNRV
jgi:hypothetical protein